MENLNNDIEKKDNSNPSLDEKVNLDKKEGGYLGYYLFIAISAIIGFAAIFNLALYGIKIGNENGIINITKYQLELSALVALIAVILFLFITIIFKKFWKKIFFTELFMYLYIGFLTTVISILAFAYFNERLNAGGKEGNLGWLVAEILSFVIAVSFAFICDKILVFKSLNFGLKKISTEFCLFVGGRLASEGIAILIMYVLINILGNKEIIAKFIVAIIVIILNYLLSKFIIFKKPKIESEEVDNGNINEESNK